MLPPTAHELEDQELAQVFAKGGETGALMRSLDWSATPCGPIASWPSSLRSAVSLCLSSGVPMVFGWGPQYVQFYNDAALPVLSDRHPRAMGRTLREVWPDIIDLVSPLTELVRKGGRPLALQDYRLVLKRNRRLEAAYYTFSFSPLRDERGDVVGVLNTFIETTRHVLSERRLHSLRELAARTAEARSADEACDEALTALALDRSDVPFALLFMTEPDGRQARLTGSFGLVQAPPLASSASLVDGATGLWPLARVARTRQPELVVDLEKSLAPLTEIGRPTPNAALVLPAARSSDPRPSAFIVVGLNPYRPLDDEYRGFLQLVAASIGAAIANARANQDARRRAEQLAELDRVKMTFIGNVSHELRTPIALILGPVDDLLADAVVTLPAEHRELLETVRRNGQRLLRLVDDLLTFARIEVGRVEPFFEPVDLAAATRELAAMFDSAAVRAGVRLVIDCPPLPEPVFVDRELWEKIVLNLISNAIKFTFAGEISVALRPQGDHVELTVRDTGVGIPADELPRVFERFYRVRSTRARTQEGAGIGLSLLRELARLHGGTVRVESVEGQGSTFTVAIPRGSAHLPQERIGAARPLTPPTIAARALELEREPRVAELIRPVDAGAPRPRVLVVEDNADMRAYLQRLLGDRFDVVLAGEGAAAIAAVRERVPDAVVSDVMMPGIDGLALVSLLREDPRSRQVPIVLLSARADEEAALEGLSRGADDYVVKPFSSRELLARLGTHIELARMRDELGQLRHKDEFMTVVSHELVTPLTSLKLVFQLARSQLEKAGAPEAAMLTRLDRALARIEALVNDLLTVSLIKREALPLVKARADLAAICRQAAEDQTAATHRTIAVEVPGEAVETDLDADGIGHVVANLLSNALKFSAADKPVALGLRRDARELVVSVRDEGPGIPADELPQLFQRFHRVPGISIQDGSKIGFGLGLYICKAIVERHGGRIWVDSVVGRGTTVCFALPCADAPALS